MRKFAELRNRMSADAQERSAAKTNLLKDRMALDELRAARLLTQKQLADTLRINQAAVSKLERRSDMYLSTLRNVVTAMGGTLEIYANFPEGRVSIERLGEDGD